jgi:heme/copper-type cytochrome/quinol oxidase subunit 2
MDHCPKIDLTIKVIGRQWYWTYEIDTFLRYRMKNPNYTDFKQTGLIYEMINHIIILLFKNKLFFHGSSDLILTKNITSPNNIFFFILSKLLSNNYDVSCINTNKIIEAYVNSFRNVHSLGNVLHADSLEENKDLS